MEVKAPPICRVHQVAVGRLFVLLDPRKGNAICLKAAYDMPPEEAEEANRVIPLHWPGDPNSVGVAIYATALPADAVMLDNARLEVNPLSARNTNERSIQSAYARDGELFLPLSDKGRFAGLVNARTGQILDNSGGNFTVFSEWYITVEDDWINREQLFPIEDQPIATE